MYQIWPAGSASTKGSKQEKSQPRARTLHDFEQGIRFTGSPASDSISIDDGKLELKSERLMKIKTLIEAGHIKPVVDRTYPMDQIVEAHKYVEQGHKRGGVAITIEHADE